MALEFLAVVCAIPHPGRISVNKHELEHRESESLPGTIQNQVEDANVNAKHLPPKQHENSDESDEVEYDDDEDDSDKINNLGNLISALNSIRENLKNKLHDKFGHNDEDSTYEIGVPSGRGPVNEDSSQDSAAVASQKQNIKEKLKNKIQDKLRHKDEDSANEVQVPSERVPVNEDSAAEAPQKQISTEREGLVHSVLPQHNSAVSNSTKGNDTASNHKPTINITQILQKIHEKLDNVIINILRPWLGNNSVEESVNGTTTNQPGNTTEPPQRNITDSDVMKGNSTGAPKPENETISPSPQPVNDTVTAAPKPGNNSVTVAPQLKDDTVTESPEPGNNLVTVAPQSDVTVTEASKPGNNTNTGVPQSKDDTVTEASEPGNNLVTVAPQSDNVTSENEDAASDTSEASIKSEVSQEEEESESTSESQVIFVNV